MLTLKGTVTQDFDANFFIPIDRPDLGDGPLTGINFGRCACAEKQAFYALSRMLKRGTNAQFRYKIALAVGLNLHPLGEQLLYPCLHEKNAQKSVFTVVIIWFKFSHPQRELLYPCLLPQWEHALTMSVNLHPRGEQLLYLCLNEKNVRKSVFTTVIIWFKFSHPQWELLYLCLLPWWEHALAVDVNLHPLQEHALSVGVDTDRAALTVSTPTDRAALAVPQMYTSTGRELLYPWVLTWWELLYPWV